MRSLALCLTVVLFMAATTPARSAPDAQTAARIAAIENGLVPGVVVTNRPRPHSRLLVRMRETHTPGVSIAFFEDGRIVWARSYGLADVASGRVVTSETLFQ